MIDKRDLKIIKILQRDGRTPYTKIARELDISETAVRKRVRSLEKDGVIKKYTIVVDPEKLGYRTVAIIGADVEPDKFLEATEKLAQMKEVKSLAISTGDHMIMMEIWTKDGKELTRIITGKIGIIDGIKRVCPAIILEKIKE